MPLLISLCFNLLLGAATAIAGAQELRASPHPVERTSLIRALLAHNLLVALPIATYIIARLSDWTLSYQFHGSRWPSIVWGLIVLLHSISAIGGLYIGAHWLRNHHARRIYILSGAIMFVLFVLGVIARKRLFVVGTFNQFRGGFGVRSIWQTHWWITVSALAMVWLGAAGHLFWFIQKKPDPRK